MNLRRSGRIVVFVVSAGALGLVFEEEPPAIAASEAPAVAPPPFGVGELGEGAAQAADPGNVGPSSCPVGMLLVDGEYCPDIEQICARWVGDPPPYANIRCAEYKKPSRCKVARTSKRFCIDRDEYVDPSATNEAGEPVPLVRKSWLEAKALCEQRGARLCKESEWELACEGPEMSPYPYGWVRDASACNFDRTDLGGAEEKLVDHRVTASAFPRCTSPYGVRHMVGNVDEWAERENAAPPYRSALRGGWWLPGRNRCRAATLHHDESYGGKQVGFRCCQEASAAPTVTQAGGAATPTTP